MRSLEGEEWRDIPGSNNAKVSNMGRIRRGNKLLKQYKEPQGYMLCSVGGELGRKRVHRLVAMAWLPNPDPSLYDRIDHISGVKDDNRVENLRWSNSSLNQLARNEQGTLVQKRKGYHIAVNVETMEANVYKTLGDMSKDLGISSQLISNALNHIKNCHGYYFFRLADIKNTVQHDDGDVLSGLFFTTGRWAEIKQDGITIKITDENDDGMDQEALRNKCRELIEQV